MALPEYTRKEWITLAECSLSYLKHSAHDQDKRQTIKEFLEDLEELIIVASHEACT